MKLILTLAIINFALIIFVSVYLYTHQNTPIADPQSHVAGTYTPHDSAKSFIKLGFVPYWNLSKINFDNLDTLTHIAYFGVAISDTGEIQTHLDDNTSEMGLHRLSHPTVTQLTSDTNHQSVLVIRAFSEESITQALDPINRTTLILQLIKLARANQFTGFNIDFEPIGDLDYLSNSLVYFTEELSIACRTEIPNCHLSIDVYASAPFNPRIWNLPKLAAYVDHVIVMGYDFYYSASPNAGPPAPIYGAPNRWKYDLQSSINELLKTIPSSQLILAVPWYGYEWTTLSSSPGSVATQNGYIATYSRAQEILTQCPLIGCVIANDSDSLSPYIIYNDERGLTHQVWYDDRTSLSNKYQLIRDGNLAGVAIWSLGYEYPYPGLWNQLKTDLP